MSLVPGHLLSLKDRFSVLEPHANTASHHKRLTQSQAGCEVPKGLGEEHPTQAGTPYGGIDKGAQGSGGKANLQVWLDVCMSRSD